MISNPELSFCSHALSVCCGFLCNPQPPSTSGQVASHEIGKENYRRKGWQQEAPSKIYSIGVYHRTFRTFIDLSPGKTTLSTDNTTIEEANFFDDESISAHSVTASGRKVSSDALPTLLSDGRSQPEMMNSLRLSLAYGVEPEMPLAPSLDSQQTAANCNASQLTVHGTCQGNLSTSLAPWYGDDDLPDTQSPTLIHDTSDNLVPERDHGVVASTGTPSSFEPSLPNTQQNPDTETSITIPQHIDGLPPNAQTSSQSQDQSIPGTSSGISKSIGCANAPNEKIPHNKLTCRERKRLTIPSSRPPKLTVAMKLWINNTNYLLDPFREDDDCWLHPSPPPPRLAANGNLRPCGKLQKTFTWHDDIGKHTIILNYGIVSKLVYHTMTKQQKDGFINKQWHLSHLCGNWVCLNPAHTTVEPGAVNISRNNCFSHRSGCPHTPQCMKEKKISLGADGKPVDHNAPVLDPTAMEVEDWNDWAQNFEDDNDIMGMEIHHAANFLD